MPKFLQKNGLTAYSLGCGNIQLIELCIPGRNIRLSMWHEGACYHVRGYDYLEGSRLFWVAEERLVDARAQWKSQARNLFGHHIAEIRKDKRYTVCREHTGYPDPQYVARFLGERIKAFDTAEAAWVGCYAYNIGRLAA